MKENFPNLVNKIDVQVQEEQRFSNKMNPEKPTPRCIIIKMHKVKDKENLTSSKQKAVVYKGALMRLSPDLSTETLQDRELARHIQGKGYLESGALDHSAILTPLARNIQSDEKQVPATKITLPIIAVIQNGRADKEPPSQEKAK